MARKRKGMSDKQLAELRQAVQLARKLERHLPEHAERTRGGTALAVREPSAVVLADHHEIILEGRVKRYAKHHRYPLTALGTITAADCAAMIGHLAPGSPVMMGAIAALGLTHGARALRLHFHRGRSRYAKWYALGSWALTMTAMLGGAAVGVINPQAQAVLWLGGLGYSATWLRNHRRKPKQAAIVRPAAVGINLSDAWPERELFHEMFCVKDAPIAGAYMEFPKRIPGTGWQAEVQLVRGKQDTGDVFKLQRSVASLYGVPFDQAILERLPSRVEDRALLTIVTEAAEFHAGTLWEGSTFDPITGLVRIGWFADGKPAHYRFYTPGSGAWHSIVTGTTGAGKSAYLSLLLSEAVNARVDGRRICADPWILDPQAQSLPTWTGRADLTALGVFTCMAALRTLYRALKARSAHMGQMTQVLPDGREIRGMGTFDPTHEVPLWPIVIDEAHMLLQDPDFGTEAAFLISQIAKLARKVGAFVVLGSQLPSLAELKDRAVRAMLAGMGATCLRSGEKLSAGMVGVDGDPFSLPRDVAGLGFTNGPDNRSAAVVHLSWVGKPARELDAIEMGGSHRLDLVARSAIGEAAAHPMATKGTPKWALEPFEYAGGGQVLRDVA
jgi:hypothetical protein